MKSRRNGPKIEITPVDALFGIENEESAMDIEIELISDFKDHPFKVVDDEKMDDLIESIRENGVLCPVLIRPKGDMGYYEMISGHRRMHAAIKAGKKKIPAIIREMTDDEATIMMVDSNIQREELLPSEKAYAYKMKLDAMNRQGMRTDLTSSQNETRFRSDSQLAEEAGISRAQVQRYIRLTELIPEILDFVDKKKISFTVAVDISFIDKEIQKWLFEYIHDNGCIKPNQIRDLRAALKEGPMTQQKMVTILNTAIMPKHVSRKITLSESKIGKYFDANYSRKDIENILISLLEQWKKGESNE